MARIRGSDKRVILPRKKPDGKRAIRVLVVDDHEVVREGVRILLERSGKILICGEAGGVAEALKQVERSPPDVALIDVRLPDGSGVEAAREIHSRWPKMRVAMMTAYPDDGDALLASIRAGASAYVLKEADGAELIRAVQAVAEGNCYLDPRVHGAVVEQLRESTAWLGGLSRDAKLARLSPRERRIAALLAEGHTNKEIAMALGISSKTAKNHTTHILRKLGLTSRAQIAAYLARSL